MATRGSSRQLRDISNLSNLDINRTEALLKKHLQPSKARNVGNIDSSYDAKKATLATKSEQIQETASLPPNSLPNGSQKTKKSLQIATDDAFNDEKVVEPDQGRAHLAAPESAVAVATSPLVEPKKHNHCLAAMSALKKRQRQKVTSNKLGEWIEEEDFDESLLEEEEEEEEMKPQEPAPGRGAGRKNSGGSAKLATTPPNNNTQKGGGGDSVVKRVQAMAAELCAEIDEIVMPESAPRPMGPSLRQQLAESWEGMSYYDRLKNIAGDGEDDGKEGSAGTKAKQQAKLRQKALAAGGDGLGLDVGLAGSGSKLHNNTNNTKPNAHIINKLSHEDLSRFMSRAIAKPQATDSNDYSTKITPQQPGSNNTKPKVRTTTSNNNNVKQPSPPVATAAVSKPPIAAQPLNGQQKQQQKAATKMEDTTALSATTARMNLLRVSAKGGVPSPDGPTGSSNSSVNQENTSPETRNDSVVSNKAELTAAQEAVKAAEKTKAAADKHAKELAAALKAAQQRVESADAALIKAKQKLMELENKAQK